MLKINNRYARYFLLTQLAEIKTSKYQKLGHLLLNTIDQKHVYLQNKYLVSFTPIKP